MLLTIVLFCSFFIAEWHSVVYIYHIFFSHLSIWWIACFHVQSLRAAINFGVHVSFWIMAFCGSTPRGGIARSCGSSRFSFLGNLHSVLHSGYTSLCSHHCFSNVCASVSSSIACGPGSPGSGKAERYSSCVMESGPSTGPVQEFCRT